MQLVLDHALEQGFLPDIQSSKILIIDDDPIIRKTLRSVYEKCGIHNIIEAENGEQGLELANHELPDLIVLDVLMPGMDGMECCRQIRKNPQQRDTPILIQTALTDLSDKQEMFAAGASDYVSKPIHPQEVVMRTFTHLERSFNAKKMRDYNKRLGQELQVARATQSLLMPSTEALNEVNERYQISTHSHLEESSELCGDFWGVTPISEHKMAVYLVDFSGHGINAALNTFRIHTLIQSHQNMADKPKKLMKKLNKLLVQMLPLGQYATMFYGVIDTKNNRLTYCSGAHPPAVLFHADGDYSMLSGEGYFVGAIEGAEYDELSIDFCADDRLLVYSDALIETPDAAGDYIEIEDFAEKYTGRNLPEITDCDAFFAEMMAEFSKTRGEFLTDDLTINWYCRH